MTVLWAKSETDGPPSGLTAELGELAGLPVETVDHSLAIDCLREAPYAVAMAEFPAAEWTPEDWLEAAQRANPRVPLVVWDTHGRIADAVRLIRLGAANYAGSGAGTEEIARLLRECADECRGGAQTAPESGAPWARFLVGTSRSMLRIHDVIRLIGPRRSTVLITGETGTGKELVARAIHMASPRAHVPMVAFNCNALPESLLEAELFGHVKGAFTGAINQRIGRFEQANRGTLFLDEIGDMPLDLQAKLLRVLQEREFQRVGSSETIRLDVRVIAATNSDLVEKVQRGKFREDLFYRLNVVPLHMPPLRDRLNDVPLLVRYFLEKICREEGMPVKEASKETIARLQRHHWPGNVRQLENAVERAVALSGDRRVLYPGDFPLPSHIPQVRTVLPSVRLPECGLNFEETVSGIERSILQQALKRTHGNKKQAAEMLHLKRTTLAAKLKSLEDQEAPVEEVPV